MPSRSCDYCGMVIPQGTACPAHKAQREAGWFPKQRIPERLRQAILRRDRHTCQHCGNPATHVDHILAESKGGRTETYNLQALCAPCNLRKGNR